MTTTVTLNLCNIEVYRLFTRELSEGKLFYEQLMNKISGLLKCCQERRVEAFLQVYQLQCEVSRTTEYIYDEIDKFEGVIDKKKHLAGKHFTFKPLHFPEARFDSGIACSLVELFEVYDRLISVLKVLRVSGCFSHDDDYFANLRRYFKTINRLLSGLLLTSVSKLSPLVFDEVLTNAPTYQDYVASQGPIDCALLLKAFHSQALPRIEDKIRQPLLTYLNQQCHEQLSPTSIPEYEAKGVA